MKKKNKIAIFTFIFIDLCIVMFLFLSYGPINYFRDLLITTAMSTKSHKYLAYTLYDDGTILSVLKNNYTKEITDDTDTSHIKLTDIKEQDNYDSKYEEQILKKDEENDLYKVISLSGNGYKGYLVAIYDPTRISLVISKYLGSSGQFLNTMAKEQNAKVAINAAGFVDVGGAGDGGTPTGQMIQNGKLVWNGAATGWGGGLAGFNKDGILMLTHSSAADAIKAGMVDGVEFGPFLVVNGQAAEIKGNGGRGVHPRTILAQRQDGIVLFFIIDGRQPGYSIGISLADMTDLLLKYKAYNAVNLDGGASSSLNINGKIINKPCAVSATGERPIPAAWMLK